MSILQNDLLFAYSKLISLIYQSLFHLKIKIVQAENVANYSTSMTILLGVERSD